MKIEEGAPLLIDLSGFGTFSEYFSSLDKKSRKSLLPSLKKNKGTTYSEIPLDAKVLGDFMFMWGSQPLHDGTFPLWGDWSPESIISLQEKGTCRVALFSLTIGAEVACIHFVFIWGNYVYCNSPLYDKSRFSFLEISKFAWLKLFEWLINNGIRYVDMVGPHWLPNSWKAVLENRSPTNEPGDFGYKWKFVPLEQKNNIPEFDLSVYSCRYCGTRGVKKENETACSCKMKKLLIVAHPDDEAIFFGNWLTKNKNETKVVCVTGYNDEVRRNEFMSSMDHLGISDYDMWDLEMSLLPFSADDVEEIKYRLRIIRDENKGSIGMVVTHSAYGEYGNLQHMILNRIVRSVFPLAIIHVYDIGKDRLDFSEIDSKMTLCSFHKSQWVTGVMEIKNSLCTGSDWYKHTVGFNMIDHEAIVPASSLMFEFSAVFINPKSISSYPFYDFFLSLVKKLGESGHSIIVKDSPDEGDISQIHVCFTPEDAEILLTMGIPYFYIIPDDTFLDDDLWSLDVSLLKRHVGGSFRSSVRTKKLRNYLGNPINLVYIPHYRSWEEISMDYESNIMMGMIWRILNNYRNVHSKKDPISDVKYLDNSVIDFLYTGHNSTGSLVSLFDKTGSSAVNYKMDLVDGNRYWIAVEDRFMREPFTLVCTEFGTDKILWSQNIVPH